MNQKSNNSMHGNSLNFSQIGQNKPSARGNNYTAIEDRPSGGVPIGYKMGSSGYKKNFALTTALKNITSQESYKNWVLLFVCVLNINF